MSLEYRIGDVFDRLAEIPDGTIDLIVTSPPFLALRSYLHADLARERVGMFLDVDGSACSSTWTAQHEPRLREVDVPEVRPRNRPPHHPRHTPHVRV